MPGKRQSWKLTQSGSGAHGLNTLLCSLSRRKENGLLSHSIWYIPQLGSDTGTDLILVHPHQTVSAPSLSILIIILILITTAWILVGAQPLDWISSPFAAHLLLFLSPLICRHQIIASLEKCMKAPCVLYPNEGHFMVAMDTWILDLKPGRVKFSYGSATSSCVTIGKSFPLSEPQCPFF